MTGKTVDELAAMLRNCEEELRYESAVAACARALLSGDSSERIEDALQALLDASDATTLFVSKNVDDPDLGFCSRLIHEATTEGFEVDNRAWRLVPWSKLPDSGAVLAAGEPFLFGRDDFGPVEAEMRARTTVKAGAQFPIFLDGRWVGLVGFLDHEAERSWSEDELRLLGAASELFARLWERQEHEQLLAESVATIRRRYDYERALAECSQVLLRGSDTEAIQVALDSLIVVADARFGLVAVNVEDPELGPSAQALCRSEVVAPGAPLEHKFEEYWYLVPWSRQPELYDRLSRGMPFAYTPAELNQAGRDLYAGSPSPTGTVVAVPIMVESEWRGLLAYGYAEERRETAEEDVTLFRTAADMIAAFWQREEAQERLEQLVRSKDEFLAAVSHELRTPLTTVVGLAEELRDRADDFSVAERRQFDALIADQGLEMANLVEDLLAAAQVDAGGIEARAVPVDLRHEADMVVGSMRAMRALVVDGKDCWAVADPMRVRQIVRNLITNAIRYGGPEVGIGCEGNAERAVVSVCDNGDEIDASARELIFEPYQRAHEDPTQPASVGLGLTLSRDLARLMGGDLTYRRERGRNVFALSLPAYPGPT